MGHIDCGSKIGGIAWTSGIGVLVATDYDTSVVAFGIRERILLIVLLNQQ